MVALPYTFLIACNFSLPLLILALKIFSEGLKLSSSFLLLFKTHHSLLDCTASTYLFWFSFFSASYYEKQNKHYIPNF